MALSIIGSGFGRTGTRSLKDALDLLGFGPCHHMEEVLPNPVQIDHWCAIARDEPPAWEQVFAGYRAQIDWPGAHIWRELATAFPDAKVIHSVRPEGRGGTASTARSASSLPSTAACPCRHISPR